MNIKQNECRLKCIENINCMGFHHENDLNGEKMCLIREFGKIKQFPVENNLKIEIEQANNATLIEEYQKIRKERDEKVEEYSKYLKNKTRIETDLKIIQNLGFMALK